MPLPALNRLSLKDSKENFFKSGKSYHSPLLQLFFIKQSEDVKKFSIVASKKSVKKAHQRNRLRRQLSFLISENLSTLPTGKYLFLIKKSPVLPNFIDLKDSLTSILSQLKV